MAQPSSGSEVRGGRPEKVATLVQRSLIETIRRLEREKEELEEKLRARAGYRSIVKERLLYRDTLIEIGWLDDEESITEAKKMANKALRASGRKD